MTAIHCVYMTHFHKVRKVGLQKFCCIFFLLVPLAPSTYGCSGGYGNAAAVNGIGDISLLFLLLGYFSFSASLGVSLLKAASQICILILSF